VTLPQAAYRDKGSMAGSRWSTLAQCIARALHEGVGILVNRHSGDINKTPNALLDWETSVNRLFISPARRPAPNTRHRHAGFGLDIAVRTLDSSESVTMMAVGSNSDVASGQRAD